MQSMHRHNDVEINVVLRGELRYVFAGRPFVVREGQVAMFWAAQPHGLVGSRAGDVCWVHVPVSTVMGWNLPEAELGALLQPWPVVTDSALVRGRMESMIPSWLAEYEAAGGSAVALLEIQAMLRRILQTTPAPTGTTAEDAPRSPGVPDSSDDPGLLGIENDSEARAFREGGSRRVPPERIDHMMAMAQFVIDNYRSALSVEDVACAAHLTPSHAMTVFRDTVGATIGEYLTMCRVAEAQRLLITTSLPTTDIAERSGFGSLSSFYAHVTAACGMPPGQYRRQVR
ncbi:Helix-turn-helix, AraC type [Corynebacterium xerosis]|nr:Helix-turn-helix, AraC type [Corynebacterium xerosis]